MAWGFWNKIKKGLKKAFNFTKNKIIKPAVDIANKVVPFVAPTLDKIKPGLGKMINTGVDIADGIFNRGDTQNAMELLRSGKIRLK